MINDIRKSTQTLTHAHTGAGEPGVPLWVSHGKQGRCASKMTKVAFTPVTARLIIYHFKQDGPDAQGLPAVFAPAELEEPPLGGSQGRKQV